MEKQREQPLGIPTGSPASTKKRKRLGKELAKNDDQYQGHGQKKQRTEATSIPYDLHSEILRRLPDKSLLRFRCACKQWNSLILHKQRIILSSWQSFQSINFQEPNVEAKQLSFPLENPGGFKILGSCNGLLCIALKSPKKVLLLCNPFTREHRRLPPLSNAFDAWLDHFGFGYDHSADDYKIVRFEHRLALRSLFGIYSLKTNSWKLMQDFSSLGSMRFSYKGFKDGTSRSGTLVNCALYWLVIDEKSYIQTILRFNLIDDKLSFSLPPFQLQDPSDGFKSELGVFGARLSITHYVDNSCVDIWALKSREEGQNTDQWTKLITIVLPTEGPPYDERWVMAPVGFMENGQLLLVVKRKGRHKPFSRAFRRGKKRFYLFNPDKKAFREFKIQGILRFNDVIMHSETLISPSSYGLSR